MTTSVVFYHYNSSANDYYPDKTYLVYYGGDKPYISYKVEILWGNQIFDLSLSKEDAPKLVSILNKYLEWNQIATRDGDMINKWIAKNLSFDKNTDFSYNFSITAYTKETHLLRIEQCIASIIGTQNCDLDHPKVLYLGPAGVAELKSDITKLQSGNFQSINYDKYK